MAKELERRIEVGRQKLILLDRDRSDLIEYMEKSEMEEYALNTALDIIENKEADHAAVRGED